MKRVLLFGQNTSELEMLAAKLHRSGIESDIAAFENLCFLLDEDDAQITLSNTGRDLREYDKILMITTPEHSKNHALNALACYCRKHKIELYDDSFSNFSGKLYEMWRFWEVELPVPKTAFGPKEFLMKALRRFGGQGVLKATHTSRGKDNFLVHSEEELGQILDQNPDGSFILQNFIPNNGDYRIVTLDFVPKLAIYRSANGKDHRNNTSLGGEATLVALDQMDSQILDMVAKAAWAFNVKIAGVDILQDSKTHQFFILEVNRTPQLLTGTFINDKVDVLEKFIQQQDDQAHS